MAHWRACRRPWGRLLCAQERHPDRRGPKGVGRRSRVVLTPRRWRQTLRRRCRPFRARHAGIREVTVTRKADSPGSMKETVKIIRVRECLVIPAVTKARDQKCYPAPEPGAGAGLSGAPPTETGPKGLGSGEIIFRDVRTTRARVFECGMLEVVNGVTALCRASVCAASEES